MTREARLANREDFRCGAEAVGAEEVDVEVEACERWVMEDMDIRRREEG